jgi:hypothetical protein
MSLILASVNAICVVPSIGKFLLSVSYYCAAVLVTVVTGKYLPFHVDYFEVVN